MTVHVDKATGVVVDVERPWLGGNIAGGDDRCIDPPVFDYLIEKFKPKSLVDVGCGEGHMMAYFKDKRIEVFGVDGLGANKETAPAGISERIVIHDYTLSPHVVPNADMVISCEFVEHVHKRFTPNYLPQFVACDTLVFTHAVEDQQGYHHVNCENDPYWINLITSLGMKYLEKETNEARGLVGANSFWGTLLIFKRPFT